MHGGNVRIDRVYSGAGVVLSGQTARKHQYFCSEAWFGLTPVFARTPSSPDTPNPAVTLRPSECGKTAGLHPEGRRSSQTVLMQYCLTLMRPVEHRHLVKVFKLEKEFKVLTSKVHMKPNLNQFTFLNKVLSQLMKYDDKCKCINVNVCIIDSVIFLFITVKLFWNNLYCMKRYTNKCDLTSRLDYEFHQSTLN